MAELGSSEQIIGGTHPKDKIDAEFGGFQGKRGERSVQSELP
jgi:hypothetical protein